MNENSSDDEMLSDDTGFASDSSEYDTDLVEKFVLSPKIRALNSRTKHCMIQCYYTTGGAVTVCATCMILVADIDAVGMHLKVYRRLQEKCKNDDYKNINVNVTKDDYYWAKKIADKSRRWCMCVKIPAGSEKCVELLIIDNIWMEFRDRDKKLALKLFFDRCDDALNMSRCCNVCGQVTCKCSVEECCFAWLQRCDECIKRQSYSVMTSVSPLDTDNPWWRGSRDSRVQRHNWSDVLCTLVASTRVATVSNWVPPVRDAIERHCSVKVNAFNDEFATNDKRAIKSINTKNIEIHRYTDLRE
ncbi:hypothetical protein ALC57_18811 [Trachymyrmex cornetzi]|uniref:Uncharacterized protein n=1 Tax=Trachymyrmex cornetzi TaxID=471704 RepID=A0A151IR01_9HYME|nr:hypothetical protein ALC57_18811 [Trachymyrmex cornetzi]